MNAKSRWVEQAVFLVGGGRCAKALIETLRKTRVAGDLRGWGRAQRYPKNRGMGFA